MLSKRIITAIVLTLILLPCLFVNWLFGMLVMAFTIIGLYEFFTMLQKKGITIYKYFGMCIGAVIPLSIILRFELTKNWELLFILLALLFLIVMQFRRSENSGVIVDISTTVFGILYVSWCLSFFIKIRYLPNGLGLFLSVLFITKFGDIGAYLIGSRFGKTPLIPRISPHKSLEGAIGGLAGSVLGALISKAFLGFSYMHLIVLGFALGILAQLGDLSESLMKRDCQVKDSGNILPGMGGILDMIDSLLFTGPAFYFYMSSIILRQ